jgi:hypothetical protein
VAAAVAVPVQADARKAAAIVRPAVAGLRVAAIDQEIAKPPQ